MKQDLLLSYRSHFPSQEYSPDDLDIAEKLAQS